jgi:S1-C subfamily serine protease
MRDWPLSIFCPPARILAVVGILAVTIAFGHTFVFAAGDVSPTAIYGVIDQAQAKMVKIYGVGGVRGMEAYQSGMLISHEGHILTVFSHVLDTSESTAVLSDGRRFQAKLLGADPRLEIAVLKIDAADLPCFDLKRAVKGEPGAKILAMSNAFNVAMGNEPVGVQRGTIAVVTRLEARRGTFETPYHGSVYVLDVTVNNSGAAGGALLTRHGELLGMLGKELRNTLNNTWLNYAIPVGSLAASAESIRAGRMTAATVEESSKKLEHPLNAAMLGIVLVPDVLERTPPYVDHVRPGSPADKAGIRADDLILLLGDRLMQSCRAVAADFEHMDENDEVKLTILRGHDLIEVVLRRSTDSVPAM